MYLFHLPFLIAENQPWGYCFELEVRTTQQWRVNLTLAIRRAAKLGGHWNCCFMNTSMISKSFESKNTVSPAQNSFSPERHKWCRSSTAEAPCLMLHAGMSSGCVLNMEEQLLVQDRRFKVGSPWVDILLLKSKALDLAAPWWEANAGQGFSFEDVKQAEKRWQWEELSCCPWDHQWHGRKSGGNRGSSSSSGRRNKLDILWHL